jgi:hypothetical protein
VCRTLQDLNLPNVSKEVVDLGASQVISEIEKTMLSVAASILNGEGEQDTSEI